MNKPKNWAPELAESDNSFLEDIFQHEKCKNLTKSDKEKISIAYDIASRAHKEQKRWDGRAYIEHIKRTVARFLTITQAEYIESDDIIVAILHDTIEDHPEYIPEIREKLSNSSVYFRVLGLSKPSANIMTDIYTNYVRAIIRNPELFFQWYWRNLEHIHYLLSTFFRKNFSQDQVRSQLELFTHLQTLWLTYSFENLRDCQNYQFFWMIAMLPERDFEIKVADRLDNLDDLQGVNLEYIEKNLISTEVYIRKAETLGRSDLVELLKQWVVQLQNRKSELTKTVSFPDLPPSS